MDSKTSIKNKLIRRLSFFVGFAVTTLVLIFGFGYGDTINVTMQSPNEGITDTRPPAPHSPEAVIKKHPIDGHTCWNGDAPKDVEYPGHVIWQKPNGFTVYSAKLVDPALNTLFGDGNLAGTPIAFCR